MRRVLAALGPQRGEKQDRSFSHHKRKSGAEKWPVGAEEEMPRGSQRFREKMLEGARRGWRRREAA